MAVNAMGGIGEGVRVGRRMAVGLGTVAVNVAAGLGGGNVWVAVGSAVAAATAVAVLVPAATAAPLLEGTYASRPFKEGLFSTTIATPIMTANTATLATVMYNG